MSQLLGQCVKREVERADHHYGQDYYHHDRDEKDVRLSRAGDEHRKVFRRQTVWRVRCHDPILEFLSLQCALRQRARTRNRLSESLH